MIKPSKILKLPADLYSRNTLYGLLVKKLVGEKPVKLLDVGGFGSKLAWFMPQTVRVTVLDGKAAQTENSTSYVQGNALKLPFEDGSFDVVLSSDTLEHVPAADRNQFISEMARVSKRHLILGAPFQSLVNERAESFINQQFKKNTGHDHPFLIEHLEHGLPDVEAVENYFQSRGFSYTKVGEGNIYNWYMQLLNSCFSKAGESASFNQYFNEHLFDLGNFRYPTYRTVFCVDKENTLVKAEFTNLIEDHNNFHTAAYLELMRRAFEEISLSTDEKNNVVQELQSLTLQHQQEIQKLQNGHQQAINQKNEEITKIQSALGEMKTLLAMQTEQIIEQNAEITNVHEELNRIHQSNDLLTKQVCAQDNLLAKISTELELKGKEVESLTKIIVQKEHNMKELRSELNMKNLRTQELETSLHSYKQSYDEIMNSNSWKLVKIYTKLKANLYVKPQKRLKKAWQVLAHLGPKAFINKTIRFFSKKDISQEANLYNIHVSNQAVQLKDEKFFKQQIAKFGFQPLMSIVMPVYNPEVIWLIKAIESVQKQLYPKWELCLADDASPNPAIRALLEKYAKEDARIKVTFRPQNGGIVKASNSALKLAKGTYIVLLDHDDELTHDALFQVVKNLQEKRYDLMYSDEDKIEEDGTYTEPYFKADFSPDLLLSNNYFSHLGVYRRKIVEEVGGFREKTDGAQDYDLVLRCTDKPRLIFHIPKVLYHWRKVKGSTAQSLDAKPYAFEAGKKALADAIKRRNIKGEVLDGLWHGSYRVKRALPENALISIIIPFRDKMDILKKCLDNIFEKTTYKNYEILLINNRSELFETIEYMKEVEYCPRLRLFHYDAPFNFSAINNFAAEHAEGEYLVLLNNDTEIIEPDWLQNMLEQAARPEVGAVGAKLLYPNDFIQHAGIIIGIAGIANCAFARFPGTDNGYFGLINAIHNRSAVTGACMMIRKEVYEKMSGLDEENLAVTFNDVDFCLRLREAGYLIVYTPYAVLYHHESLTRGYDVAMSEQVYMHRRHQNILKDGDPYYNQNLTKERLDFSLRISDKVQSD